MTTDVEKDLVEVKGTADWTELRSDIKTKLKKDVEIEDPTEVEFPVKKGKGITEKKQNLDGDIE